MLVKTPKYTKCIPNITFYIGYTFSVFWCLTIRLQPKWFYLLYESNTLKGYTVKMFYRLVHILWNIHFTFCAASSETLNTPFTYYFIFQNILLRGIINYNNVMGTLTKDLNLV